MMGLSRREFLQSAAAGAGLALSRSAMGGQAAPKGDDLHFAIIGVGREGQTLLDSCRKIPNLRLRAVCDIWPYKRNAVVNRYRRYNQEEAKQTKRALPPINGYVDYQDMLAQEKDLDAVIVATPDWVHHEHTIAALEAGRHVYCEKEMSNKLENARKMVETARRTGKLLQIGHQRRSNPRYIFARQFIAKNPVLGRITHVSGQWNRYTLLERAAADNIGLDADTLKKYGYENMDQFLNWRWYRKYSGGAIADIGSHQVDIFNWFLEASPASVVATGGRDFYEGREWYDNVLCLYDWNYTWQGVTKPVRGFYQTITTSSHGGYYETFMGTEGSLIISEDTKKGGLQREDKADEAPWEKEFQRLLKNAYTEEQKQKEDESVEIEADGVQLNVRPSPPGRRYPLPLPPGYKTKPYHQWHLENFFGAVRDGRPLNCPGEVGYETAVSVLRVNDAVASGAPIKFKPEDFKA